MHWSHVAGIALITLAGTPLAAQSGRPLSVDVTVGFGTGWGGHYTDRGALATEITLVPGHGTARVFAVTVGGRATPVGGDKCAIDRAFSSQCLRQFPAIAHLGVLSGVEGLLPIGTVRAMLGPAVYVGQGRSGLGAQLQLDASAGFEHLAFVVASRGSWIARFSGERLGLGSLQVGFRLR